MDKKFIKLDDIETEEHKFHQNENLILINEYRY